MISSRRRAGLVTDTLIRKLENFAPLSTAETATILAAATDLHTAPARTDLIREGDPTGPVHLILDGFACRYKLLPDGRRQIVGYLVPGDLCDVRVLMLEHMDHTIGTLTPTTYSLLSREAVLEVIESSPRITKAMWWATLVEEATTREWLVNIGQRSAIERTAHLICELYYRLRAVGLAADGGFFLPLTQTELGDTLGLSTVHVNRTMQELRGQRIIETQGRSYMILDLERLSGIAMFNANYLHLPQMSATSQTERAEPVSPVS